MRKQFSSYDLKLIAAVTMLIDHIGVTLVWNLLDMTNPLLFTLYECIRLVGRMSFPLYCFLIVEGFLHTRSVPRYAGRLLVFAVISEIPYDMAINLRLWARHDSNVFFTLLIGLLLLWGISYVEKFYVFWREKELDVFIGTVCTGVLALLLMIPAFAIAQKGVCSDYGMAGVLAIVLMYLFRNYRLLGFGFAVMLLGILTSNTEYAALLMLYPVYYYDGTRGRDTWRYVFYGFYPVHLLVLGALCMLLVV